MDFLFVFWQASTNMNWLKDRKYYCQYLWIQEHRFDLWLASWQMWKVVEDLLTTDVQIHVSLEGLWILWIAVMCLLIFCLIFCQSVRHYFSCNNFTVNCQLCRAPSVICNTPLVQRWNTIAKSCHLVLCDWGYRYSVLARLSSVFQSHLLVHLKHKLIWWSHYNFATYKETVLQVKFISFLISLHRDHQ